MLLRRFSQIPFRCTSFAAGLRSTHSVAQSVHYRPGRPSVAQMWIPRRKSLKIINQLSRAKTSSGYATSTTVHSSTSDPAEAEAVKCLEQGTQKLEQGDVQSAKALYQRSVDIKRNASSLFNLGVTHYHLSGYWNLYVPFCICDAINRGIRRSNCIVERVHSTAAI